MRDCITNERIKNILRPFVKKGSSTCKTDRELIAVDCSISSNARVLFALMPYGFAKHFHQYIDPFLADPLE